MANTLKTTTFSENFDINDNATILGAAFIADKGSKGATWVELVQFFHGNNRISDTEKSQLLEFINGGGNPYSLEENNNFRNLIISYSFDDTFHRTNNGIKILFTGLSSLIDFIELKHARKNSIEAKRYSIIAIIISVVALAVSIYFGYKQLNSSVKFDEQQLKSILSTNKNQIDFFNKKIITIDAKLDSLPFKYVNKGLKKKPNR